MLTRKQWLLVGTVLWLLLIGTGMALLWLHTQTPGLAAQAPGDWPAASRLQLAADRPTLMMWCHPKCPCTSASLDELEELVRRSGQKASVQLSFVRPPGCSSEWVRGALWHRAEGIPGARLVMDDGGEARRFGVKTSGQVLLFDRHGRLLFKGGLTGGRGHQGENAGLETALRLVKAGTGERQTAPVFGCSLFGPETAIAPGTTRGVAAAGEATR